MKKPRHGKQVNGFAWQTLLSDSRDSPLGYRLPLESQPWVSKEDYPYINPANQCYSKLKSYTRH